MRESDKGRKFNPRSRTSQIIFGERQHLQSVLDSISRFRMKPARMKTEKSRLKALIAQRTAELNAINPAWDKKMVAARDAKTASDRLRKLAAAAPPQDFMLVRTLAENPSTPADALAALMQHPYDAVKENVARHPNADAATLELLAADEKRPLWFLVACNAAAPATLREKLRFKLQDAVAKGV